MCALCVTKPRLSVPRLGHVATFDVFSARTAKPHNSATTQPDDSKKALQDALLNGQNGGAVAEIFEGELGGDFGTFFVTCSTTGTLTVRGAG